MLPRKVSYQVEFPVSYDAEGEEVGEGSEEDDGREDVALTVQLEAALLHRGLRQNHGVAESGP